MTGIYPPKGISEPVVAHLQLVLLVAFYSWHNARTVPYPVDTMSVVPGNWNWLHVNMQCRAEVNTWALPSLRFVYHHGVLLRDNLLVHQQMSLAIWNDWLLCFNEELRHCARSFLNSGKTRKTLVRIFESGICEARVRLLVLGIWR